MLETDTIRTLSNINQRSNTMKFRTLALAISFAFAAHAAQAATYVEDFEASFPTWESGWLGTNSNLTNVYGVGAGRGNNPDGLWIGVQSIQFNAGFGASISSLDFDVASWVSGTINVYDMANTLIGSNSFVPNFGAYTNPGTYDHFSYTSSNGVSRFDFVGSGIVGNTSIDNVTVNGAVTAVPEPETLAMLLAGLGLMGAVVRQRKTNIG